jgi:hypothetical protein
MGDALLARMLTLPARPSPDTHRNVRHMDKTVLNSSDVRTMKLVGMDTSEKVLSVFRSMEGLGDVPCLGKVQKMSGGAPA